MTQVPRPGSETTRLHFVYDAWNRLAAAKNDNGGSPGTTIATYSYDAKGRRIRKAINGGDTFDYYYNDGYQHLEVRKNADTDSLEHYVWDISYIDAPLIWFRDSNVDGTVDDTMYPARDANFNVTALIDTSGTVQERYYYDPYGKRTILNDSWGARGSSSYDWTLGHQGLMLDSETGLYYNRARMLHPTLGRDPLGYIGGVNLYGYARNTPILLRDPLGLLECNKDNEGERRGVALETVFSPRNNNNNPGDTNRLLNFAIILLLISDIPIPGVTNPAEILRFFHANEPTGSSCRKQGASSACDMNVTRWCAAIALGLNGPGVRARSGGLLWVPPWSLSLSDGTSGTTCFGTIRQVGWICVVLRQSPTARCP